MLPWQGDLCVSGNLVGAYGHPFGVRPNMLGKETLHGGKKRLPMTLPAQKVIAIGELYVGVRLVAFL